MASNYKIPPALGPDTLYESWKSEIEVWRLVTDLEKKRQALAVTLSLSGQAKAKALELNVTDLNSDTGMDKLLEALDSLFERDKIDLTYAAYVKFDSYKRDIDTPISEYIIEYERRYNQCKKYDMVLPDPVLSCKILDGANLSQKERQLVLTAAADLKFETMKSSLKRIFGADNFGQGIGESSNAGIAIKQESAFLTQRYHSNDNRGPPRFQKTRTNSTDVSNRDLPGTNPLNKYGKRSRCAICQSVCHWMKDCPHRSEQTVHMTEQYETNNDCREEESCNLTLYANEYKTANEIFLTEALGCAVIDTACTRTVCGKRWFDNYVENLSERDKAKVNISPSNKMFKFGDGNKVESAHKAVIPAKIADTSCNIETEIVNVDLPLLLSKTSLKRAGTILNLQNDKAEMFQKPVQLNFTSSGHYCIDISGKIESNPCEVLVFNENISPDERKRILEKLHKQFGHASKEKLIKLLQSSGVTDSNVVCQLDEIISKCDICLKYKRPSPKPAVGLPLATEFNGMVAVDLHQLERNLWYLHIIDEFTRFSAGAIMKSKESKVFVQKFIQHWIGIFGAPKKLFSDNGGEFNNMEVQDMCENFNIELKSTAGYSPWSNGLLERHNQTLTDILQKVKVGDMDWETSLSWALMAKNSLSNVYGYSAYQLVFGKNPNLPNTMVDKPPALEGTTTSAVVEKHIVSLYATRKAFMEAECSDRIRRALRKQIRPSQSNYETGDKVYYKRQDSPEWKGPGVVIGQDGVVVFVRHAGMLVRVHQCRLQKAPCSFAENPEEKPPKADVNAQSERYHDSSQATRGYIEEIDDEVRDQNDDDHTSEAMSQTPGISNTSNLKIKPGQKVTYKDQHTGNVVSAKVLGRAGKATGRNKDWFNLEYLEPEGIKGISQSVDLSQVDGLEVNSETETEIVSEQVQIVGEMSWNNAKLDEIENWKKHDVFVEENDAGQKCVSTRWVCTMKETAEGLVPKARLVARGFEEKDKEIEKDSPTCSSESLRMILAIIAQNKWKPHSMDIKTAFLQSQKLDRNIYIRPPPEAKCTGKVWHLYKCVYGLSDASLCWYKKVRSLMRELGAQVSKVDPAVFYWSDMQGKLTGVLATHVDDFIWAGNQEFEGKVISIIRSKLNVGKEDDQVFKYLGIELRSDNDQILHLHQNQYADNISFIQVDKVRSLQKDTSLTESERKILRSKIGQMLWMARQSRPDICFDVTSLAGRVKTATVNELLEANKIIKRIKADKTILKFQHLGDSDLSLVVYSDASLGNLVDGGTQGGHVILLVGQGGRCSPIHWSSKRIRRVVRSTLAGETLAMADGIDDGIFFATLYAELTVGKPDPKVLPICCVTDCKALFEAIKSNKFVTEKRLRLEISAIKEKLENRQLEKIDWCDSSNQLADCLTKKGASTYQLMRIIEEGVLSGI